MQVFIKGCAQRLEAEVVNDQQRYFGQGGEFALVGAGGTRAVQTLRQIGTGAKVIAVNQTRFEKISSLLLPVEQQNWDQSARMQ